MVMNPKPVISAQARAEAEDWQAAIRVACQPLLRSGAIEPRYIDRCIEIVEANGPYMVVAPGVALAHARPEDGVKRLCLSATTLNKPVAFGHPENDPVDLVFAFGSPGPDQHISLLQALAKALQSGLAEDLRSAENTEHAERIMRGVVEDVRE